MYADKALTELGIEASPAVAEALAERLAQFLAPLLSDLDAQGRQTPGAHLSDHHPGHHPISPSVPSWPSPSPISSMVNPSGWWSPDRARDASPGYLLTSEPIRRAEDAWRVVFAYARRWQVEMAWRYSRSELAMESPRLWFWENRLKLLLMATLAYAFLLSLLEPCPPGAASMAASLLVPSNWKADSRNLNSALPPPIGLEPTRASLSPATPAPKFGMTHVC